MQALDLVWELQDQVPALDLVWELQDQVPALDLEPFLHRQLEQFYTTEGATGPGASLGP